MQDARGKILVDLGAGTGKLTQSLSDWHSTLVGVEPVEAMRKKFMKKLPHLEIHPGRAEKIPLGNASADCVVVAQAFHWFDGDLALKEIARVLKEKGKLVLLWNVRDEQFPWIARLTTLIDRYQGDSPRFRTEAWKKSFTTTTLFTSLAVATFSHSHESTPAQLLDRVLSISFVAALPAREQTLLLANVKNLLDTHPATKDYKTVSMKYRTYLYWCEKRGST